MELATDGTGAPTSRSTTIPLEVTANGLYLKVALGPLHIRCLLDSGCNTDVVLAAWLFESIPEEECPDLSHPLQTIRQANGTNLLYYGHTGMQLSLSDTISRQAKVYVADIEEEAIIGVTCLRALGASIDFLGGTLIISQSNDLDFHPGDNGSPPLDSLHCHRILMPDHLEDLCQRTERGVPSEYSPKSDDYSMSTEMFSLKASSILVKLMLFNIG